MKREVINDIANTTKKYVDKVSNPVSMVLGKVAPPAGKAFELGKLGFDVAYNVSGIPEDMSKEGVSQRMANAFQQAKEKGYKEGAWYGKGLDPKRFKQVCY